MTKTCPRCLMQTPLEPTWPAQVKCALCGRVHGDPKDFVGIPLRVDFGGGWLDVPKFARSGAFIVNCAISPLVSRASWHYARKSGLGGSAARAILDGKDPVQCEVAGLGVGWQDPAVILETGLCVWNSGPFASLHAKINPSFLSGCMALYYTGIAHDTPNLVDKPRSYDLIEQAGALAAKGALALDPYVIAKAINLSFVAQRDEGMEGPFTASERGRLLEFGATAWKYCGGGYGGYVLVLFQDREHRDAFICGKRKLLPDTTHWTVIEPYLWQMNSALPAAPLR